MLNLVVPRKGDVDRNAGKPSRRKRRSVVPRKGDVDRNIKNLAVIYGTRVVPRKGDVDRNATSSRDRFSRSCRPPQGGRG